MLRTIRLYGRLKKQFGPEFKFEAETPAECVRALCLLVPGFMEECKKGAYKFVRGNRQMGLHLEEATLTLQLGNTRELHLIPSRAHAGKGGVGKIIVGVALIGIAVATGGMAIPAIGLGATAGTMSAMGGLMVGTTMGLFAAGVGLMLVMGGISTLLTPKPKMNKPTDTERDQSFLFGGSTNTAGQGVAVPIVYGRVRAGSVVVSAGMDVEQISTGQPVPGGGGGYLDDGTGGGIITDPTSGSVTSVTPSGTDNLAGTDTTWGDDGIDVMFSKGGKGGAPTSTTAQEGPNTLQSNATVRFIDAISEGPCFGLADRSNPMKSVYLDDVPLQAPDGTWNRKGIQLTERLGNPSDDPVLGFGAAETERGVGIQVTQSVSPVVAINDANVTEARVTLTIPSLYKVDTKDGSVDPTDLAFKIEVQPNGGTYTEVVNTTISGKTNAQYQKAFRFVLPGTGPWNIKVSRITPDSAETVLQNDLYFSNLTEIISARLQYPDTAHIAVQADAKQFGSNVPNRAYDWKGRIIRVPANYNPETRVYATTGTGTTGGVWDGTFKLAWTDNPAWILYDLLTHPRYGLGNDIPEAYHNKWALYEIGQYCDASVPNGAGGTEPRFTINTQIVDRGEAWDLLMSIVSVFRGMFYWGAGQLEFSYDHDETPTKIVTKANVIGGKINYSSDPYKARHSVAIIAWNDPELGHRTNYEVVEDRELIAKYGYKTIETTAWGCTSRGQAHRVGRWILDTEKYGEIVQYTASVDHADVRPGTVVEINDPEYLSYRNAGRLGVGSTTTVLQLDAELDKQNSGGKVKVVLADGTVVERNVTDGAGLTTSLTLSAALPSLPLDGAMWSYAEPGITNRLWRVLAVEEAGPMEFRISAMYHDPNKFARVERNIDLAPNSFSNLGQLAGPLAGPTNLSLSDVFLSRGDVQTAGLLASWTPAADPRVNFYEYQLKKNSDTDWGVIGRTPRVSIEIADKVEATSYDLRVRSCTSSGIQSKWRLLSLQALTGGSGAIAAPANLTKAKDDQAAATVLRWSRLNDATGGLGSGTWRRFRYEVLHHASSSDPAVATSLGTTDNLEFPVARAGIYHVRGVYGAAVGAVSTITVTIDDLPMYAILADNILTGREKEETLANFAASLQSQYDQLSARATALGLSTTALSTARTNWRALLDSYSLLESFGTKFVPVNGMRYSSATTGSPDYESAVRIPTPFSGDCSATLPIDTGAWNIFALDDDSDSRDYPQQRHYHSSNGTTYYIYENGTQVASAALPAGATKLRIKRVGSTVTYHTVDASDVETLLYTSTQSSTGNLWAKFYAYSYGTTYGPVAVGSGATGAWNDYNADTDIYTHFFDDENFPAGWTLAGNMTATANGVYTTLTDNDTVNPTNISRTKTQTGVNQYSAGYLIKKDTVGKATRHVELRLYSTGGVAAKYATYFFDTSTGEIAVNLTGADAFGVLDLGDEWLVWITLTTISDNTAIVDAIVPAGGTNLNLQASALTGSVDVRPPLIVQGDANDLGRAMLVGRMNAYTAELQKLAKAISERDAQLANWPDVTGVGRPSDNAGTTLSLVDLGNSAIVGNQVTKATGGNNWSDHAAYGREPMVGTAIAQFRFGASNTSQMAGLTDEPTFFGVDIYKTLDFAFFGVNTGVLRCFDGGASRVVGDPAYTANDVLTITYDGLNVRYYQNDTLLRTVATTAGRTLWFKHTANTLGAVCNDIRTGLYTDNNFDSIGGPNVPEPLATRSRVFRQPTAPTSPNVNDTWVDTDAVPRQIYTWTGAAWELSGTVGSSIGNNTFAADGTTLLGAVALLNGEITLNAGGYLNNIGTTQPLSNASITIGSGALNGIGTGAGTVVGNSLVSLSTTGLFDNGAGGGSAITALDFYGGLAGAPLISMHSVSDAAVMGFNPAFDAWASTYPDGWSVWSFAVGSSLAKETTVRRVGRHSVKMVSTGGSAGIVRQVNTGKQSPAGSFITGTVDVYIVGGATGGSPGILVDVLYNGTASYRRTTVNADMAQVDGWQRVPFTARVNAGERISGVRIYMMGSYSGMAGGQFAGTVYFDNLDFTLHEQSIDNQNISISGGAIQGIGTGAGTAVANGSISVSGGRISGIGTGNLSYVDNNNITISSGAINGIGTGTGTAVANSSITVSSGAIGGIGTGTGTVVANSSVSLSPSGVFDNGAGGGSSITALDIANVANKSLANLDSVAHTAIMRGAPNLLRNGSMRLVNGNGWLAGGWDQGANWALASDGGGVEGNYAINSGGGTTVCMSDPFKVIAGSSYSLQADLYANLSAGSVQCDVQWFTNAAGTTGQVDGDGPVHSGTTGWARKFAGVTAPAGAVSARIRFFIAGATGTAAVRRIKFAAVSYGTGYDLPFSDEATNSSALLTRSGEGVRLADGRNQTSNRSFGLRATTSTISLTGVDDGTTARIDIGSSTWYPDWGGSITFPPASITGLLFSTKYYVWRNQADPTTIGTSYQASTNVNDALGLGKAYLGYCTTPADGGSSTGGTGGGFDCVHPLAWVETEHGFVRAKFVKAGDRLVCLNEAKDGTRLVEVESNHIGENERVRLLMESGAQVTLSINTPLTLRGDALIIAANATGHDLPVKDKNGFRWERCVRVEDAGLGEVSHIRCHQATYAAGDLVGRSILTHNPKQ